MRCSIERSMVADHDVRTYDEGVRKRVLAAIKRIVQAEAATFGHAHGTGDKSRFPDRVQAARPTATTWNFGHVPHFNQPNPRFGQVHPTLGARVEAMVIAARASRIAFVLAIRFRRPRAFLRGWRSKDYSRDVLIGALPPGSIRDWRYVFSISCAKRSSSMTASD